MKKINSPKNRSGLVGLLLAVLGISFGVSSCRPDFDLDTRMPEGLGTSIYETLKEGFSNDSTQEYYTFNTFVRLIEDLNQVDVLAKTGSKTMFVADDKAFERFFGPNCPFTDANGNPVTSYDQLSKAQKTMILNGSMLNNVYQVAMLSSSPGGEQAPPILGNCMRRVSASSVLDTSPVVMPSQMPQNNKYWDRLRNKTDKGIVLLQDGTNKPLIFFVNKFLESNRIDKDDYDFLFRLGNYSRPGQNKPAHKPGDATVNGATIAWPNKRCFNGFLHVMSDVVYLLPNMAEYIATAPNARIYSSILDRFSVPTYSSADRAARDLNVRGMLDDGLLTSAKLNDAMNANGDSIFVKKYLSSRARSGSGRLSVTTNLDNMSPSNSLLKFDPGWNSFISSTVNSNTDVALQSDMGLMMVPVDEKLMQWWLDPDQVGASLRATYGLLKDVPAEQMTVDMVIEDMAGVPLDVIVELVNNNMQISMVGSVPSKFSSVLNDAQDPFFETRTREEAEATIDDVVMCCNGAVYFTNTVYVPTAYRSVSYPVLVNEKLKIINWAIRKDEQLAYSAYLNSMVAEYSFFVPLIDTVPGSPFENKMVWIDPASFYLKKIGAAEGTSLKALAFSYGKNSKDEEKVIADIYDFDETTGTFVETGKQLVPEMVSSGSGESENDATKFIRNRLLDLMDYHIIIGDVEDTNVKDGNGFSYFRSKGRGTIRFKTDGTENFENWTVEGGWQIENEGAAPEIQFPIKIVKRVDLSKKTNTIAPGNGRTYIIDRPLMPSRKSVYDIVSDSINYPEFKEFFKVMQFAGVFGETSNLNEIASQRCVSSFNTYHYTVYIPKNDGVKALFDNKVLLTPTELAAIDQEYDFIKEDLEYDYAEDPKRDSIVTIAFRDSLLELSYQLFGVRDTAGADAAVAKRKSGETDAQFNKRNGSRYFTNLKLDQLKNFVKYHIQDNSVYVGAEFNAGIDDATGLAADKAEYETAYMNARQQFIKLTVKGGSQISVTDKAGNTRYVQQTYDEESGKPYYNIMCREYEIKPLTDGLTLSDDTYDRFSIETSSYAVVHLIDKPLNYGELNF